MDCDSVNVSVDVVGQDFLYPFKYVVGDLFATGDWFAVFVGAGDGAGNFGWEGVATDDEVDGGVNVWHGFPFGLGGLVTALYRIIGIRVKHRSAVSLRRAEHQHRGLSVR